MGEREDQIRARLQAATDPPWLAQGDYVLSVPQAEAGWDQPAICRVTEAGTLRDAELIAHAPDDLAYLLHRVEELERTNGQLQLLASLPLPHASIEAELPGERSGTVP